MMKPVARLSVLAATMLASFAACAVSVSPVKLETQSGERATALGVTNDSDTPHTYDIRIYKWLGTNESGAMLEETTSVITARPVITVPAKSAATVRIAVVSRSEAPADYYRVILDDITPAADGAGFRLRLSMPVQVINRKGGKGELELELDGDALVNHGTAAVFVSGVKRADGSTDTGNFHYVLPGERWATKYRVQDLVWSSGIQ